MIFVDFHSQRTFTAADDLRAAFGDNSLVLEPSARLTVLGRIYLDSQISFAGDCKLTGEVWVERGCVLTNTQLKSGTRARVYSVLSEFASGERNLLGPFCFLRDGCIAGDGVILGAHVEAARSRFADDVKVSHRAFIGDAEVGERVIIGAGVVFCNFDGSGHRRVTRIGADAIIGAGSLLVAPLAIGAKALVAAGSVATKDLPDGARLVQKR